MEKQSQSQSPPTPLKPLSPAEWETLLDDFQHGGSRRERWTSSRYTGFSLLELSLSTFLRRDFPIPLKLHLLVFLEEGAAEGLFSDQVLPVLLDALRALLQAPIDGVSLTYPLREQMLLSTTSIFLTLAVDDPGGDSERFLGELAALTELLLTVINRPNHGQDRQVRAAACECLRELERAYPCLLSEVAGQLWGLCQSERTNSAQSYVLLFAAVVHGVVTKPYASLSSLLGTSIPLVPFSIPNYLLDSAAATSNANFDVKDVSSGPSSGSSSSSGNSSQAQKGVVRRAMAFLLEWPQFLTPPGMMEFMSIILPVAEALDLQPSLLKVQFSGLLYTFDPLLCHFFLIMYSRFLDAFSGQASHIGRRLVSVSRESQHYLVFRLLTLHWLMGLAPFLPNAEVGKDRTILDISTGFYPTVYDPLSLKSLKLDLLAYCSVLLAESESANAKGITLDNVDAGTGLSVLKLFNDGLVSVSAFKWLPPWSTETAVAFRAFHKFLVGSSSHSDSDPSSTRTLLGSSIFHELQKLLVDFVIQFNSLVPSIVVFLNRLLACHKHSWLGEHLLQTFDEYLLPKVILDYQLACYFPILYKIAENDMIPPSRLIDLLTRFMIFLVEEHGTDTRLKSWSLGSKVLDVCRSMLSNHHSSRVFLRLSHLLAFTCTYFPDLEIRDDARIYLRMLVCVPGKKLRLVLNSRDQLPGVAPSSQPSPYYNVPSPRPARDLKKSRSISSYIYLERMIPLLVKQLWSLSLSTLGIGSEIPSFIESIRDSEPSVDQVELNEAKDVQVLSEVERIEYPKEPLRVMDSKISGIIEVLRRHFSSIPDFRHMRGLKAGIYCHLKFKAEVFSRIWEVGSPACGLNQLDMLPALYATVLSFSSTAPYGTIPPYRVPFLLGGPPPGRDESSDPRNSLGIVPTENDYENNCYKATVVIELEPREPVPGLVDVSIRANTGNGQIIDGKLQSITVGIEDMFFKAILPPDLSKDAAAEYCLDLFNALWEACGSCSNTGREVFPLKGGKGAAAIRGTQSVKLLEVPATSLIDAVEHYLAHFVVGVIGESLVNVVKDQGIIRDVIWKDVDLESVKIAISDTNKGPLLLKSNEGENEDEMDRNSHVRQKNMGCFLILIFLPPRFHLLFRMEVCDFSTLVRIRTDHWPCLAYVDDYLEALFSA